MGKIRILPDILASKIAAGEVVERPASVVKELVENALDAGSRHIRIAVELGGKKAISVTDDGEGMTRDDALLAFERHATSKIAAIEDLEQIRTLGFRGEALPSIAAVSKLLLRTKTADEMVGTEIAIEGGRIVDVRECAGPSGTEVHVRDLFYNVPARRKFLKSETTELFHITTLVTHYALAYPHVAFHLTHEGRVLVDVTPVEALADRVYQVFGAEFLENLIAVEYATENVRVFGFASAPNWGRTTREAQYFFVNGRYVRDRVLAQALSESYQTLLPSGTHPAAILFVEVPPSDVDVNVHPAKIEVRFRRPDRVRAAVIEGVRRALGRARPIVEVKRSGESQGDRARAVEPTPETFPLRAPHPSGTPHQPALRLTFSPRVPASAPSDSLGVPSRSGDQPECSEASAEVSSTISPACLAPLSLEALPQEVEADQVRVLGQFRQSFIIAATARELLLIDQHAAHERILFERFRAALARGSIPSQPLLVPEIVELTPAAYAAFEGIREELVRWGFEVGEFSGRALALTAIPADLPLSEVRPLVWELLEVADQERRSRSPERLRERVAASLACRAAVKINTPLTDSLQQWLVEELFRTASAMSCPHGRPVVVKFTLREIERLFHR